ncbi:TPA: hypothetical protein PKT66_003848 [Acinetobacter baumannii]|nr:hypothetical protein [Acinetobacter baumannii]
MTFIIAIQLNDSIVVTADSKKIVLKESEKIQFSPEKTQKIYSWNKGIITGTGEDYVIKRSIEFFKKIAHSDLNALPQCLDISRQLRELEIGKDYFQVENTKLLCSSYSERGAQLYTIQRFEPSQPYKIMAAKTMDIIVWLFHPNIDAISIDLQNLYADLKDYVAFTNKTDWINYYINRLAPIYHKQSQQDPLMSQSFDFFFQTKDEYITGYIPNTNNVALKIQEIFTELDSI